MPPDAVLNLVTGAGGALIVLSVLGWALATGRLHSDREFQAKEGECQRERTRADRLQQALDIANARADTGTRTTELTVGILKALHAEGTQR